jgi:hypothetical protein
VLNADGIPVSELFQNAARMGPATARAYALSVDGARCPTTVIRPWPGMSPMRSQDRLAGARLAKEHKDSPRRIDACVSMVMAVHPAAEVRSGCQTRGGRYDPRSGAKQRALGPTVDGLIPRRLGRISPAAPERRPVNLR